MNELLVIIRRGTLLSCIFYVDSLTLETDWPVQFKKFRLADIAIHADIMSGTQH